jgi:uncharacterized membrane protein
MKTENRILMQQAREALLGKWALAIQATVIYILAIGVIHVIPILGTIVSIVITGPLAVGMAIFSLSISRNQETSVSQLFNGFSKFALAFGAYILMIVFTILWMLLLIVPGIIAAISYSQTFFIIAEDDSIDAMTAIDRSKAMMQGYKWKYFCLCWRFFGWFILSCLTCGIGFLWLIPYVMVSFAKFYEDIKIDAPVV